MNTKNLKTVFKNTTVMKNFVFQVFYILSIKKLVEKTNLILIIKKMCMKNFFFNENW
ncbi:hypothetical protein [Malacoplasma penetrans]|uniref:Uncharacterized protein n=1 Tax=Malacoplasma penetrans (strain HF-2) TaxID=272633 RepID=Q8EUP2_MALP2|nr:hypothetical protein [Malacoplasma penetrans]BAC44670.1 hypothetical protein [Malacoplasma penetrans HF-2]